MIFRRRILRKSDASRLTQRLWDFTGTAMLNLFVFLFLVVYLSPLPFMVESALYSFRKIENANLLLQSYQARHHMLRFVDTFEQTL